MDPPACTSPGWDGTEQPHTHHGEGNGTSAAHSPVSGSPLSGEVGTNPSVPVCRCGCKKICLHMGWQGDIVTVKVPPKPFPDSTALVSSLPMAFTFISSLKVLHLFSVMCQCGRAVPSRGAPLMPPPLAFTSAAVPTGHRANAGVLMWDLPTFLCPANIPPPKCSQGC